MLFVFVRYMNLHVFFFSKGEVFLNFDIFVDMCLTKLFGKKSMIKNRYT